jgi:hypothetical protein
MTALPYSTRTPEFSAQYALFFSDFLGNIFFTGFRLWTEKIVRGRTGIARFSSPQEDGNAGTTTPV